MKKYFGKIFEKYLKIFVEVSCDWTGSGELTCYGHLSTDVSQAGGQYLEAGKLTCTPVEWPYPAQVSSHWWKLELQKPLLRPSSC